MKKVKISNVRSVPRVKVYIGLDGNEVVRSSNNQQNILDIVSENDLNKINENVDPGHHCFNFNTDAINAPSTLENGVVEHIQRAPSGSFTSSQLIQQRVLTISGVYVRTGAGNGRSIVFKPWKLIEL